MNYQIEYFEKYNDQRGQLVVFLRNSNLKKKEKTFGQIYFVTFEKKGAVRGNHYHKKWEEWFGVISGKVKVILEDVKTKKRVSLTLDSEGKKYVRLKIGPNIAHAIKNATPYAAVLNYANDEWSDKDTFPYKIL